MKSRVMLIGALVAAMQVHAAGNEELGLQQYKQRCAVCHSVDENRIGPAHRGVFGRKVGSASGFKYSEALKNSKVIWDEKTLNAWLTNPEKFIPGQAMFIQVSDAKAREDIIAYLSTLKP